MKKLLESAGAKAVAAILFILSATGAITGAWVALLYRATEEQRGYNAAFFELETASVPFFRFMDTHILELLACVAALLAFVCLCFLLAAAGHKKGADGIAAGRLDRPPFDIFFVAACLVGFHIWFLPGRFYTADFSVIFGMEGSYSVFSTVFMLVLFLIATAVDVILLLGLLYTFAARVKRGGWWRNMAVYIVLHGLWMLGVKGVKAMPIIWKTLVFSAVWMLIALALAFSPYSFRGMCLVLLVIYGLAALGFLGYLAWQAAQLQHCASRIAAGDLDSRVDTNLFVLDFKAHGETLNHIRDGMDRAVEERLRSERFRTELITNVSHDLKTPITSIVNYVDLLRKDGVEAETAAGYLEVLARQTDRLRKLTEDLVEASKASSGSMPVALDTRDAAELVRQSLGEYSERFEQVGLTPVVALPDAPVPARLDGKLFWRALDNLFGNACKYSLPDTRLYVTLAGDTLTLRNVTRDPISLTPEELTERFVRGDPSRSGEGSGLGLAIARSLLELQGGTLRIDVDGDLFKAAVTFVRA